MLEFKIPEKLTSYCYDSILNDCFISYSDKFEKPEPVYFQNNIEIVDILTRGNISMIQGRAKSRKTFALLYIVSEIINKNTSVNNVVLIDTEQYKYHSSIFVKRLMKLTGNGIDKFSMFNVRKFSKDVRLQFVQDFIIQNKPDILFIDNIRDIIKNFNDIGQSDDIITTLSQLAEEYGTHICCTLHQNKGDNNARGHLGSELTQKAETVFSVETDENTEVTTIKGAYTRNKNFNDINFHLVDGIPTTLEEFQSFKDDTPDF